METTLLSFGVIDFIKFMSLGMAIATGLFYPLAMGMLIYKGFKLG